MGMIHDVNVENLATFFNVDKNSYKKLSTDISLIRKYLSQGVDKKEFFKTGISADFIDKNIDLSQFKDFSEAYHRLMFDLTLLNSESINLISDEKDGVNRIYISGGFARNEIFVRLIANLYPDKEVFTSEIDNSSALGAALVIWDSILKGKMQVIDLGLKKWDAF
jgi:sugar (pentulose or hexulose) kinase